MKKKHYSPNHLTQPARPARDIDFFYLVARLAALLMLSLFIALVSQASDTAQQTADEKFMTLSTEDFPNAIRITRDEI